jgi:hypothetical protein
MANELYNVYVYFCVPGLPYFIVIKPIDRDFKLCAPNEYLQEMLVVYVNSKLKTSRL